MSAGVLVSEPATHLQPLNDAPNIITSRVHARIGLLGNPSDGYNGKTISFALANFWAEVRFGWRVVSATQQQSGCCSTVCP